MSRIPDRRGYARTDFIAYGCAVSAIAFIFALTFGAMDTPDPNRNLAFNTQSSEASATP